MYWRARGEDAAARHWADQCGPRDFRLPPRSGRGQDGSHNFAPCLLAGAGRWDELGEVLTEYWDRGAGNEFNSPLYGGRVLTAAILWHLLGGGGAEATRFVRRWIGFLSLQAIVVRDQPRREQFVWAGERKRLSHQTRTGVAVPPTGLRINGDALGNPYFAPVLACILGIEQHYHHVPQHWLRWTAPADVSAWRATGYRGNAPNPWALVDTIYTADSRRGFRIRNSPFVRFCREVVEGDMKKWRELADRVQAAGVPLPIRGLKRFVIERRPRAVMTWWEGRSPTRQKPSVAAAAVVADRGRRPHTALLVPAAWNVPSDETRSRLVGVDPDDSGIRAEAHGNVARMDRLLERLAMVEFR